MLMSEQQPKSLQNTTQKRSKTDLDAVSIAVPTTLHKDIALKAANYGVHILVEKPIASH